MVAVALVVASVRMSGQAGQFSGLAVPPVLIGSLRGPNVREALRGSISPDGRLLAYEVVVGQDRNIWLRDLTSGAVRALTERGHENRGVVWSPDGYSIAFVADSMVAVANVTTGVRRIVFDGTLTGYSYPIVDLLRWYSDSELTIGYLEPDIRGKAPKSLWAVRVDSTDAHELPRFWGDSVGAVASPDEQWVARWAATSAGRGGLWVSRPSDHHGRCLAEVFSGDSPLFWSPGNAALLFIGHTGVDATPRVYQLDLHRGVAARVSSVTGSAFSLSVNERGDVAIISRPTGTAVAGDLWLGRYPLAVNERDTLAHCRDMPADVARWVRQQHLPTVHGVSEVAAVPHQQLSLFHVVYGPEEDFNVHPNLFGLRYRGRIGWLIPPQPPSANTSKPTLKPFELKAGDAYLLGPQWDSTLAHASPTATDWWRNVLLSSPATPLSRLAAMVAQDPSAASVVAHNPALKSTTATTRDLLGLAAVNPTVAATVMDNPRIAHDLRAWRWIEARFANWPNATEILRKHMWTHERELLSDALTPEPILLEVLLNRYPIPNGDTLLYRLLVNPTAQRSLRIVTILAVDRRDIPDSLRRLSLAVLAKRGLTRDRAVRTVLLAQAGDSVPCDENVRLVDASNLGDEAIAFQTEFVTAPSHRCVDTRQQVGVDLARGVRTPPSSLRALGVWLADSRDEPIAAALIANRVVRGDSEALRLLAAQPLSVVARQADSLLHTPHRWVWVTEPVIRWDTTAWVRADSGRSVILAWVPAGPSLSHRLATASSPDSLRLVIRDKDAWRELLNRLAPEFDVRRPDFFLARPIDFKRFAVVVASNGVDPSGSVARFNGASMLHDTVYVKVLTSSGIPPGCASGGQGHQVAIALVPWPASPVVFLEGRWTRTCSLW